MESVAAQVPDDYDFIFDVFEIVNFFRKGESDAQK